MIHLDLQIRRQLLHEITNGIYANATMLPSEAELCERLGVSRSTLRQAVTVLEQEHYLRRRQGIGTEIDRNVCSTRGRLDLNPEFSTFLSEQGYVPERKFLHYKQEGADAALARALSVEEGEPLLSLAKLWYADGHPAIWCTDTLPVRLIQKPYTEADLDTDIFTFLDRYTKQKVSFQIAPIEIKLLDEEFAQLLDRPVNEAVFYLNCTDYNAEGKPVIVTHEIYVPKYVSLTVMKAKI
ncbi:MAG: GntR family transcriptional regulator [Anaerolineaceae bacterium]